MQGLFLTLVVAVHLLVDISGLQVRDKKPRWDDSLWDTAVGAVKNHPLWNDSVLNATINVIDDDGNATIKLAMNDTGLNDSQLNATVIVAGNDTQNAAVDMAVDDIGLNGSKWNAGVNGSVDGTPNERTDSWLNATVDWPVNDTPKKWNESQWRTTVNEPGNTAPKDSLGYIQMKDFFIFAGQSNCIGMAHVDELNESYQDIPESMLVSFGNNSNSEFHKYQLNTVSVFGPDVTFSRIMAERQYPDEYMGILKIARGNTSLDEDWAPGAALFNEMVFQTNHKKWSKTCRDGPCRPQALIWIQGEADACAYPQATRYYENMKRFAKRFRQSIGEPYLPIFVVELQPTGHVFQQCEKGLIEVRNAQQKFSYQQRELAELIQTSDFATFTDEDPETSLHYNTEGMLQLGDALVKSYVERRKRLDNMIAAGVTLDVDNDD